MKAAPPARSKYTSKIFSPKDVNISHKMLTKWQGNNVLRS